MCNLIISYCRRVSRISPNRKDVCMSWPAARFSEVADWEDDPYTARCYDGMALRARRPAACS